MRITVDRDKCESNGMCVGVLPAVFEINDDDDLDIVDPSPPDALRDKVDEAVRRCPKQALTVTD